MKQPKTLRSVILPLTLIIILNSCSSESGFVSRKYTPGFYREFSAPYSICPPVLITERIWFFDLLSVVREHTIIDSQDLPCGLQKNFNISP